MSDIDPASLYLLWTALGSAGSVCATARSSISNPAGGRVGKGLLPTLVGGANSKWRYDVQRRRHRPVHVTDDVGSGSAELPVERRLSAPCKRRKERSANLSRPGQWRPTPPSAPGYPCA